MGHEPRLKLRRVPSERKSRLGEGRGIRFCDDGEIVEGARQLSRDLVLGIISRTQLLHSVLDLVDSVGDRIVCVKEEQFVINSPVVRTLLPHIPKPYCFKGGAARAALRATLSEDLSVPEMRDIDLVRKGIPGSRLTAADLNVSKKYMPIDTMHGHGVEIVSSWERYFWSRDVTINEVLVEQDIVSCSWLCLLDTLGFVLRPCRYYLGSLRKPPMLSRRVLFKAVRLYCEGLRRGEPWLLQGIDHEDCQVPSDDRAFRIELSKCLAVSHRRAIDFVRSCRGFGLINVME